MDNMEGQKAQECLGRKKSIYIAVESTIQRRTFKVIVNKK